MLLCITQWHQSIIATCQTRGSQAECSPSGHFVWPRVGGQTVASSTSPGLVLTCGTCVCCLTVGGRWRNRRSPVNRVEIMWPTPPVMSVLSFSASSLPLAPDHSSKSSVFQSFSNCPTIHHFPPSVWFQTPGFLSNPGLFRKEESFFVARCSQRSSTAVNQTTS